MNTAMVQPPGRQGPGRMPAPVVARLDVSLARRAGGVLPGEHRTLGVGAGTELAQLRPYEPGDDLRQLDPAASARTAVPHVRQHVPERAMTTWLLLDVSPSMAFGTGDRLKSDVAEGVALAIAQLAVRRGGRLALVTAGAAKARVLEPRGGRAAIAAVRRVLREGVACDATEHPVTLADSLSRVHRLARSRGLVVVASDLRDEGWARPLRRLTARHSAVVVEVTDPREAALPEAGRMLLTDPETGMQVEADTSSPQLRRAFSQAERERRSRVLEATRRAGAEHVTLSTQGDWLRELTRRLR
ncbi:MAG: DUF58 domain-containing protein [Actinomycetota bacterium]|nr:DUF58 domain-containing protein [Actinomycetota bacterium]